MNEEMCAVHFLLDCFRMALALLFLGHDILHIGHCIGRNGGRAGGRAYLMERSILAKGRCMAHSTARRLGISTITTATDHKKL